MKPLGLLPCPFCGAVEPKVAAAVGMHNFTDVMVVCETCSTQGPLFDEAGNVEANTRLAVEHWNTRAKVSA